MSSTSLGPYVNFLGRAREAMQFYQEVLGGKLEMLSLDERGAAKPPQRRRSRFWILRPNQAR